MAWMSTYGVLAFPNNDTLCPLEIVFSLTLIVSYVTSLNLWKDFQSLVILINTLGFSVTVLYAHVLIRQALIVENHRKFLVKNDSTFKKYKTERTWGIPSNYVLGFFLPVKRGLNPFMRNH